MLGNPLVLDSTVLYGYPHEYALCKQITQAIGMQNIAIYVIYDKIK